MVSPTDAFINYISRFMVMYGEDTKNNIFFFPTTVTNIKYESHLFCGI
jgi:hypothetical protein